MVSFSEIAKQIGFLPQQDLTDIDGVSHRWKCTTIDISVIHQIGLDLHDGFTLSGNYRSTNGRTASSIVHRLPPEVSSFEQGLAILSHYLRDFELDDSKTADWIRHGWSLQKELPWYVEELKPEASAWVHPDWFKFILGRMKTIKTPDSENTIASIRFDGEILVIRIGTEILVMPAQGEPWTGSFYFIFPSSNSFQLKLNYSSTSVEVSEKTIKIGRYKFERVEGL